MLSFAEELSFGEMFDAYLSHRFSWFLFSDEVDLWRTAPFLTRQDQAVVLRARSRDAPGYLRGRSYSLYRNGKWKAGPSRRSLALSVPDRELPSW